MAPDGTQVPRHNRTMPGTSWLPHPDTAAFKRGPHRAQRFVHLAWLPAPSAAGYSRAVPLRLEPAFPAKAVAAEGHPPRTEWEAGLAGLAWVRQELDAAGRSEQRVPALADAAHGNKQSWAGLPERTALLARRRRYGARAPKPHDWLAERRGRRRATLAVRGRAIPVTFRVEGPSLVGGRRTGRCSC